MELESGEEGWESESGEGGGVDFESGSDLVESGVEGKEGGVDCFVGVIGSTFVVVDVAGVVLSFMGVDGLVVCDEANGFVLLLVPYSFSRNFLRENK